MMRTKHLYIHIPFCTTICAYCDFCHRVYDEKLAGQWLASFKQEIKECEKEEYETIYIGGGTPTSLNARQLEEVLQCIEPFAKKVQEYTIEVNPENLEEEKIILFKKYGINRVSMGLESSDDEILKLLHRNHSFIDVKKKVELLQKHGIDNISLDILYSLPGQTMADLKQTVNDALLLNVPHLSLYSLTIEENTIFGKKGYKSLNSDIEADMYEYIVSTLQEHGYNQYEVANFAKDGYESSHNMGYWKYDDFRGLSCGSSSKINHCRYEKSRNILDYINGKDIICNKIELSKEDEMFEHLMMSLRTKKGLDLNEFEKRYQQSALEYFKIAIDKNKDLLEIKNNYLSVKNREILNHILVDFIND